MPDYLETLRLEYQAEEAVRQAKAMSYELAEVNQAAVAQAGAMRGAGDAIALVGDTYDLLPQDIREVSEATADLTRAQGKLDAALNATGKGTEKLKGGLAGTGQSFLQVGRVVQDFAQGGIGGVLNNIEGLVQALGGPAGLAGVLTVVGVSFYALKPYIADFLASLKSGDVDQFKTSVERLKDKITELADKPAKLAVDVLELDIAQSKLDALIRSQQAFQALGGQRSRQERESGQEVEALIGEEAGGVSRLRDELKRLLVQDLTASNQFLQESERRLAELETEIPKRAAAAARGGDPATQAALDRALADARAEREAIREQRRATREAIGGDKGEAATRTADIFTGAFAGDVEQQRRLAELAQRAGRGRLAADIPGASPAAIAAAEDEDRAELEFQQGNEQAKQARLRRLAAAKKRADAEKADAARELELAQLGERLLNEGLRPGETEDAGRKRIAAEKQANRETDAQRRKNLAAAKARDEPIVEGLAGGVGLPVEGLLAQNAFERAQNDAIRARGGRGVRGGVASDEQAAAILTERLSALLQRTGQDTDPLHARAVAGEVVQKAQEDLQKKTGQALGQTQNLQAATLQVIQQVANDLSTMDQRTALLWQQLAGIRQQRQQVVRTSQNRAR